MREMFATKTVLLCCLLAAFSVIFGDDSIVSVRIKNGVIRGRKETSLDGKQLHVFRGIPYAEPPVGDLRFRRPLPARPLEEPLNAFDFSKVCFQSQGFLKSMQNFKDEDFSEDCLYLNVWSPAESEDSPKAVMVWIHGGGLLVGSAREKEYSGHALSALGDVVFVSINYRLSVFGFLYSGEESAPGNVGLWDQALALEWINDNIRYFGGDDQRITIFGESAGSWSVSLHILSPASRHLFHNAIMSSGAYTNNLIDARNEDYLEMWLLGAELMGCGQNETRFTAEVLQCLRTLSADSLADIVSIPQLNSREIAFFFLVVIDGHFLPKSPTEMLSSGDVKRDLNLLFSTNEDEGSFILQSMYSFRYFHAKQPFNYTRKQAADELANIATKVSLAFEADGAEVARLYFAGLSDERNSFHELRRTMGIAVGDYYITCPTLEFAKEVFRSGGMKAKVFEYVFNSKLRDNFLCAQWMGVCHGNDLIPMFGLPLTSGSGNYSNREKEISRQMIDFLTHFAKTGALPPQSGAHWPHFYAIDDHIIAPFYEVTSQPKPVSNFGVGFKINECEYLWRKYVFF